MKLSLRTKFVIFLVPLCVVSLLVIPLLWLPYHALQTTLSEVRVRTHQTLLAQQFARDLDREIRGHFELLITRDFRRVPQLQAVRTRMQQTLAEVKDFRSPADPTPENIQERATSLSGKLAALERYLQQLNLHDAESLHRLTQDRSKEIVEELDERSDSLSDQAQQLAQDVEEELAQELSQLQSTTRSLWLFFTPQLRRAVGQTTRDASHMLLAGRFARLTGRQLREYAEVYLLQADENMPDRVMAVAATSHALAAWSSALQAGAGEISEDSQLETELTDSHTQLTHKGEELLVLLQSHPPPETIIRRLEEIALLSDNIEHKIDSHVQEDQANLSHSLVALERSVRWTQTWGTSLLMGILGIGLGSPWLLSRFLLTPLLQIQRSVEKIGGGALDTRITLSSADELGALGQAINGMTHSLQEAFTERQQVEETLRESEERFRGAFENAPIGMTLISLEGQWVKANAAFCDMVGYSEPELIGRTFQSLTHQTDLTTNAEPYQHLLAGERDSLSQEKRYFHKAGHLVWAQVNTTVVRSAAGTPQYLVSQVLNVTARKQAEAGLRESQGRLAGIINSAMDAILTVDEAQNIVLLNPAAATMFRYEEAALLGQPLDRLLPARFRPTHRAHVRQFGQTGVSMRAMGALGALYGVRADGEEFPVEASISQVVVEGQKLYTVILRDITEQKRNEEEKGKLQEQLFQAQKLEAIGTLTGGIAHDFNNMLTIILGFSELLQKAVRADAVAQGNLEQVRKAGTRAKELVKQLLAFSRPEPQTRSPVDLHLVVAEALRLLRAVLPTTIAIRSSLASSGAVVLANTTQLHQVIMNLGVNALHAMQDTGGVLEVRVEPTIVTSALARLHPSLTPGAYCQLTVRDTGSGMTPEVMARIFDPFFTTKPAGEGTGLGLSVIHGIVSSYGGTITVDSSPGQGTVFTVYLPQSPEAVASPTPVALPARSTPGRVVLFVDDEKAVAQMAQQMLAQLGYEAVVTSSSHEALEIFRHRPGHFDVVVTDQTMPGLTGDQLARELLTLRPEVPIIVCTGFSPTLTEEKARALGIRTYLRKPLSIAELGQALEEIFTSREET